MMPALLAVLLVGCGAADRDGDGFRTPLDCDDADATVNPGAAEVCDGIDNDCSGEADDSPTDGSTVYLDLDGDGYGLGAGVMLCDSTGHASTDGDCNDSDATVHPGAVELCNGLDNDCDGVADNGQAEATFYIDSDGDGYGSLSASTTDCAAPAGYVNNSDDCDDTDPTLSPETRWFPDADGDEQGAALGYVTSCTDPSDSTLTYVPTDTDCLDTDSTVYLGAVAEDPAACMQDADGDGFGSASPPEGVDAGTDCDDTDASVYTGAVAENAAACMIDMDGDGFGARSPDRDDVDPGTDCDDSDARVYPGAASEDPAACMQDLDGDGFGAGEPEGDTVDAGTDCDDTDADTHPGAVETCDDDDNDCNGTIDDSYAVDADTWYLDDDGDGYGDTASTLLSCTPVSAYVSDGTDCDDTDADVSPDAWESCTDGIDNDCDGSVDEVCISTVEDADVVLSGSSTTGHLGFYGLNASGDLNGDGDSDLTIGAYRDGSSYEGMVYILSGPLTGGAAPTADVDAAVTITGEDSNTYLGITLTIGDVDDDGYDDLIVGAEGADNGSISSAGGAFVFYGPVTGALTTADADLSFLGEMSGDSYGENVVAAYDYDGDGTDEVIAGSRAVDLSATNQGVVGIHSKGADGDDYTDAATALTGGGANAYAGYAFEGPGDVNGDGANDLLYGAYGDNEAYLIYGPATGLLSPTDADVTLTDSGGSGNIGSALGSGDFNDDGYIDVVIGDFYGGSASAGALYVLSGPISGTTSLVSAADATVTGDGSSEYLGRYDSADACGDVDDDGTADLLLGSYNNDTNGINAGGTFLFYGPLSGRRVISKADVVIYGTASTDHGIAVALGDLSGDGLLDITASSYRAASYDGQAFVLFNGSF